MSQMVSLPDECIIRPASKSDMWSIRKLVLLAWLEPTQIRPQQFWVIERERKIIACGQLRSFEQAQELGSLVVDAVWRDRFRDAGPWGSKKNGKRY